MTPPSPRLRKTAPLLAAALIAALLVAGVAMVMIAREAADDGSGGIASAQIGGAFKLVDGDGRTVTDATYRGRLLLVYFGYTFCPDVCPTTLSAVAAALDHLGARADGVQTVFVTVDPKRDTPGVVKGYAAAFSPRIIGLTGSPEQIAAVARAYRVYYAEHRTGPGPNDYTMDHSSILYLMGPDGAFLGVIRADSGPGAIEAELARHLPSA